jgi:hypothetical protein
MDLPMPIFWQSRLLGGALTHDDEGGPVYRVGRLGLTFVDHGAAQCFGAADPGVARGRADGDK